MGSVRDDCGCDGWFAETATPRDDALSGRQLATIENGLEYNDLVIRPLCCLLFASTLLPAQGRGPAQAPLPPAPFDVVEATISQVHEAMKAGRLTCRELVGDYLKRIEVYDKNGPAINSIVILNPDATNEAAELDRRFAQSGLTGPLHCVPVIVKDNFETKGLQTTDGALAFAGYLPEKDAFLVKRMKDAGALVLAKSNMAEWAFSPYETVNSILPGYTHNPYALNRVTAGSSGGTAAAVAASFGLVGLGSDTGNSIRGPSSHQALVGIRSTMGLTSRAGVMPLSMLADIAGPMTRTVEDAARVFQAIVGEDADDPVTAAAPAHLPQDYLAALDRDGLHGAVIGVLHQAYDRPTTDPEIVRVFQTALDDMKRAGATIVDPATVEGIEAIRRPRDVGPCMGFKYDMNHYLAARAGHVPMKDLGEIVRSGRFHPNNQGRLESAEKGAENGPDTPACKADAGYREQVRDAVLKTMDKLKLDAFVYPTWSNPPRLIGDMNTPHGDNSQFYSPTTGFPAINVPMGYTRGGALPAGMTVYGRAWSEAKLIKFAYAFEQATHHRRAPASAPPLR
jgi:amidase